MFTRCERNKVQYIIGISKNKRLTALSIRIAVKSKKKFRKTKCKSKLYTEIYYAAKTRKSGRRKVIVKAEYTIKGRNLRYIITNIADKLKYLYERRYGKQNKRTTA